MNFKNSILIWLKASIVVAFAIGLVRLIYIYPEYFWGNQNFHEKYDFFKKNNHNYNTIYIGASDVARGFVPTVFDRKNSNNGLKIKSYNFGSDLLSMPESIFLLDKIVDDEKFMHIDNLLVNLYPIRSIDDKYLHTVRTKYWYSLDYLKFVLRAIELCKYPEKNKRNAKKTHVISFAEKRLGIDMFSKLIAYKRNFYGFSVPYSDGYQNYDLMIMGENRFAKAHIKFLKSPNFLSKLKEDMSVKFKEFSPSRQVNLVYFNKLMELIEKARMKGMKLTFILPPRLHAWEYDELLPVFFVLPEENKIDMANPNNYPMFYFKKNSFDNIHFNHTGAKLYSSILADEFVKKNSPSE